MKKSTIEKGEVAKFSGILIDEALALKLIKDVRYGEIDSESLKRYKKLVKSMLKDLECYGKVTKEYKNLIVAQKEIAKLTAEIVKLKQSTTSQD